jgi:hypothetical protein
MQRSAEKDPGPDLRLFAGAKKDVVENVRIFVSDHHAASFHTFPHAALALHRFGSDLGVANHGDDRQQRQGRELERRVLHAKLHSLLTLVVNASLHNPNLLLFPIRIIPVFGILGEGVRRR